MMKQLIANDPATRSANLIAENIARSKALFPELITEGTDGAAVNVDVLKQLVGDKTVTDADEKYGLTWHGKRRARQLALKKIKEAHPDWDGDTGFRVFKFCPKEGSLGQNKNT